MPLNRFKTIALATRTRPCGPSCRGGASSVLRLTQPAQSLMPSRSNLSDWLSHAAEVMLPVTGPHFAVGPHGSVGQP